MRHQNELRKDLRKRIKRHEPDEEDEILDLIFDVASYDEQNAAAAARMLAQGTGFILPVRRRQEEC